MEVVNSIVSDEVAHHEPPHLGLRLLNSQYDIVFFFFFLNFAGINFDVCFFYTLLIGIFVKIKKKIL